MSNEWKYIGYYLAGIRSNTERLRELYQTLDGLEDEETMKPFAEALRRLSAAVDEMDDVAYEPVGGKA